MSITIPIEIVELDSDGIHLLIACTIENNAFLIIDTGASKSVIDANLLENITYESIPVETIESSQLTGMIEGEIIQLPQIIIGENSFQNFQALSMPLSHVNSIYERFIDAPIAGLIGGDFLQKYNAVIDYSKAELILNIQQP